LATKIGKNIILQPHPFDMDKKECVGHDVVEGPPLPQTYSSGDLGGNLYAGMPAIIKRIEVRLLPLKLEYQEANPKRLEGTWSGKVTKDNRNYMIHYTFEGNKLKYEWEITYPRKISTICEGSIIYNGNTIIFTPEKVISNGKEKKKELHFSDDPVLFYTLTNKELFFYATEGFHMASAGRFYQIVTEVGSAVDWELIRGKWLVDEGPGNSTVLDFKTSTDFHLLLYQKKKKTVDRDFKYTIDSKNITFKMPKGNFTCPYYLTTGSLKFENYMGVPGLTAVFVRKE